MAKQNLAVDSGLHKRVKANSASLGVPLFDLTDQLLRFSLRHMDLKTGLPKALKMVGPEGK